MPKVAIACNRCYHFGFFTQEKMKNIKDLTVKVTYEVGLGGLEMPQDVYDEIQEADENGHEIDGMSSAGKYLKASEWLGKNIKESDCMVWKAEVIELIEKPE